MLLYSEVNNVTDDRVHAFRCVVPTRNSIHHHGQALESVLGIHVRRDGPQNYQVKPLWEWIMAQMHALIPHSSCATEYGW